MAIHDLTIDDIGAQGDGIAHEKGATIFVEGALAGEKVRVEMEDKKGLVKRAKPLSFLTRSPVRVQPPCPHFPQCGGCRFQHMNDEAYGNHKLGQLQQLFVRERLALDDALLPLIVTAPGTRRRARLAAHHGKNGIVLGFNEWRSHEIVNVATCPVLLPKLELFIKDLRSKLAVWLPPEQTCDIQITALASGLDIVMIGGPKLDLNGRQRLAALAECLNIEHLSWRKWDRSPIEPVAHRSPLNVHFGHTHQPFPPGSFLQATEMGEKALIDFVRDVSGAGQRVLDLFSGLGTFGLSLPEAKSVVFSDIDGPAMETLGQTAKHNPHLSISLKNLSVDPFTTGECNDFDLVIFDPPRGGAKAQAAQLAKSKVPQIVAISCDPSSFVRDAKILMGGGYKLKSLLPVDQFLWSPHMELAAHFGKE